MTGNERWIPGLWNKKYYRVFQVPGCMPGTFFINLNFGIIAQVIS